MKNKKASSFHEFARNTSDAWDIGDDEDEDFSSFQTLNSKVAKATAAQVLENHSRLRVKPEWPQAALSEVSTNCKVIKSNSEAQLSRAPGKIPVTICDLKIMGACTGVTFDGGYRSEYAENFRCSSSNGTLFPLGT